MLTQLLVLFLPFTVFSEELSEIRTPHGHKVEQHFTLPLPSSYISAEDLPDSFHWGNVDGKSYLTKSLNQHIPQYCGSCWAHGSLSSLSDRIKIARNASGEDINLSVQYILNCGSDVAGSCHGGSATGTFEFIHKHSGFVPYDTCQPYLACSSDSAEGFCPSIDTSCNLINTCRTCSAFLATIDFRCKAISHFPNATIAEYGTIQRDVHQIKAEIFARGPVAAEVNGKALHNYTGGVFTDQNSSEKPTHIVSIVGWSVDNDGIEHWIVRNSWGQYWGEMGFFRIQLGLNLLGIEKKISWAIPGSYSEADFPCENGKDCLSTNALQTTVDRVT